ncbi:MAG: sigma-70 family RNA polymerase sigma factor [Candidatus Aminicenantes bacterium]|nr:sigma-70 family RNA polymerase sigma factor [Candidatus Aminicenantes bacterium]MDH5466161.1 sigma-70 family RNA polymerase sigma factor [Candidatus Aminicenantes bacterium]MDH5704693.1 sigma-70 family RNA polymerase sigma factor [Candidatus Aminicenantes bacterium]
MADRSDDHLVDLAKQGDVEAFAELARRCQERIFYSIFALTKNHQDASDLTQEALMQAFKSLKTFKQRSSFNTWVYRIAVNLTLNFLKKGKRDGARQVLDESLSWAEAKEDASPSPEGSSLKKELSRKLREAVDSLPLPYRASFVLVVFQGMTHNQAARVLGCSENTVSWRMHKARKILQASLNPYLEGR